MLGSPSMNSVTAASVSAWKARYSPKREVGPSSACWAVTSASCSKMVGAWPLDAQPGVPGGQVASAGVAGRGRQLELGVQALRVAGVEIPNNKKVPFSLRYIYGIGPTTADAVVAKTAVDPDTRVKDLTEEEITALRSEVENGGYLIEGDLRRFDSMNIKRLKENGCYRGRRHIMGLPVRGQKTKTNARTRKGKKRTVAGKKK